MGSRSKALITPEVLKWARERAKLSLEEAAEKIKRPAEEIASWEDGSQMPSIAQARRASKVYKRPFAAFYLPEPPKDFDTLRDFRSLPGEERGVFSPELELIIREAFFRQKELRLILIQEGVQPLSFVGSASLDDNPIDVAEDIRRSLKITYEDQREFSNRTQAFKVWMNKVEDIGIFVFRRRNIPLREARGFTISDDIVPIIFINSDDSKTGQVFTLAHELAHLWLDVGGISNYETEFFTLNTEDEIRNIEIFCNKVAANVLIDEATFTNNWRSIVQSYQIDDAIEKLANRFFVSEEMVARRVLDMGEINQEKYQELRWYFAERFNQFKEIERKRWKESDGGPSYYLKAASMLGYSLTKTVIAAYLSGSISARDASHILSVKVNNMQKLGEVVGMPGIVGEG